MESEFEKYRRFVKANLDKMVELFAHISVDDFSKRIRPEDVQDDEFGPVLCGLDMMMDDLIEVRKRHEQMKGSLETQVRERTVELLETNRKLALDIARRERAEGALFEREKFLAEVFSSIQDPISVLDKELTIVRVNAAMEQWYLGKMPITGKKCYWVYHNRDRPCEVCPSLRTIKTNRASTEIVDKCDSEGVKTGWSEVNAFPWRDARTGELLGVIEHVRDVTDRIRLENELFKVKKLESLGILAGGIAHDFNNILTGIVSNIFLAKTRAAADPETRRLLEDAEKASLHASKLVQQLITFSKGGAPVKETITLTELIRETAAFSLAGAGVDSVLELSPDLWPVNADRTQIEEVLNNLIINAAQAMPQGGTVRIVSENATIGKAERLAGGPLAALPAGRYVKITVADTGVGIPSENIDKIFDPYFTTKEKGNGLGLTTAYSIVNQHKGAITIDSTIGAGTKVSFFLPAADGTPLRPMQPGAPATALKGERILILDDDDAVRTALEKMLAQTGLRVTATARGEDAVAEYERSWKNGERYSFVIMDLTIRGGMGGKDAVRKLLEINPAANVIAASGYSNDPILADPRKYGFAGALSKPFEMNRLVAVLGRAGTLKNGNVP